MYQVCTSLPCNDQPQVINHTVRWLSHHGRLSSASTGRLAALLLPFALVLFELNIIDSLAGGASTSISSSSKSDILFRQQSDSALYGDVWSIPGAVWFKWRLGRRDSR